MACITLLPPMAMTTTQLARTVRYEAAEAWQFDGGHDCTSLRLSWVVVTDEGGNRHLRMQWSSAADA